MSLQGFSTASKSKSVNGSLSTLVVNGGNDCGSGRTPDLTVRGGALVKKQMCVLGASDLRELTVRKECSMRSNLRVEKSIYAEDLIINGSVLAAGNSLIDKLSANSACVTEDLVVAGNIVGTGDAILDNIDAKTITSIDLCVSGNLISNNSQVVLLKTFNSNAAVWIEPAATLLPMTITLDNLPCSGIIQNVSPTTGNIFYIPVKNNPLPEIDVFNYHGMNSKGFNINVTQLICFQQIQLIPPFLQNICLNRAPLSNFTDTLSAIGSYSQSYGSIVSSSMNGTFPIDWSSLAFTSITSYTQNQSGVKNCVQWLAVPPVLGTNVSTALNSAGTPLSGNSIQFASASVVGAIFTFTVVHDNTGNITLQYVISGANAVFNSDFIISVGVQVSDIYGNLSNISTMFIQESSNTLMFTPSSGPIGSIVTVTGSADFTNTTAFSVNGFPGLVISSTPSSMIGFVMPGTTNGIVSVTTVANGTLTSSSQFSVTPTLTPISQQGPKLVGTGATPVTQGTGIALSADGNTLASAGNSYYTVVPSGIWVFKRTAGVWSQEGTKLLAGGEIGNAHIGSDKQGVAISADGNTLIAGGPTDNSNQGAVWVFTRSAGVWTQQAKLTVTGNIGAAGFGDVVHLSADGNTLISSGAGDNGGFGAAWIFVRNAGVWTQQTKLVGSGNIGTPRQGWAVALSSDGNTAGLGGDLDNGGIGAVWVFTRSGTSWSQQAKIIGSGYSGIPRISNCAFSADGNIMAIGGGTDGGNGSFGTGAIWIFDRTGSSWAQRGSKYTPVSSDFNSQIAVGPGGLSADGNTLVVSGWRDNGDRGAQWVLSRNGNTWNSVIKITNPEPGSNYGNAPGYISSDSTTMGVGSRNSPNNTGIGGVFVYV